MLRWSVNELFKGSEEETCSVLRVNLVATEENFMHVNPPSGNETDFFVNWTDMPTQDWTVQSLHFVSRVWMCLWLCLRVFCILRCGNVFKMHRKISQWPHGLRHALCWSAHTLGSWVRTSLDPWKSVFAFILFVLSCVCSGLATGLAPVQGISRNLLILNGNKPKSKIHPRTRMTIKTYCCFWLPLFSEVMSFCVNHYISWKLTVEFEAFTEVVLNNSII
jgi:hypothetical protein